MLRLHTQEDLNRLYACLDNVSAVECGSCFSNNCAGLAAIDKALSKPYPLTSAYYNPQNLGDLSGGFERTLLARNGEVFNWPERIKRQESVLFCWLA